MAENFEGKVMYLIKLDSMENEIIQDEMNPVIECDQWLPNESNLSDDVSTIYLNITEGDILETVEADGNSKNTQQVQNIPKKVKSKSQPNILRNRKNKCNGDQNADKLELIKNEILKSRRPTCLEIKVLYDTAFLTFKDEKGHQLFSTQHLKVNVPNVKQIII